MVHVRKKETHERVIEIDRVMSVGRASYEYTPPLIPGSTEVTIVFGEGHSAMKLKLFFPDLHELRDLIDATIKQFAADLPVEVQHMLGY